MVPLSGFGPYKGWNARKALMLFYSNTIGTEICREKPGFCRRSHKVAKRLRMRQKKTSTTGALVLEAESD